MSDTERQFGTELRRRRTESKLSLRELSELVHYSKGYLSKIENGWRQPPQDFARRCDDALGCGGRLAALVPRGERSRDGGGRWGSRFGEGALVFAATGQTHYVPGLARLVSEDGGTSLAPGFTAEPGPIARPAALTVGYLADLFDTYRSIGRVAGPAVVLPGLIAHTHVISAMARSARSGHLERLLALGSRYAEYVGWMTQESGDNRAAMWWTDQAVAMATAAGDHELASYARVREALIAMYDEDAVRTIGLARQAQEDRDVSARVRALAIQREAQGHALAGDYDQCQRALDGAADWFERSRSETDDRPVLGSTSAPDTFTLLIGWAMFDLGRTGRAVEVLAGGLERLPPTAGRTRARFGIRLALAHTADGNLDVVAELIERLLPEVIAVDSATVRHDLRQLRRALARWDSRPPIRELRSRLTTAIHPPRG